MLPQKIFENLHAVMDILVLFQKLLAKFVLTFDPNSECFTQGWQPGYLALGCQFQFRCVETQMSGFSFGLVSRLLKNRFQFRFQFCLHTTSVSGF